MLLNFIYILVFSVEAALENATLVVLEQLDMQVFFCFLLTMGVGAGVDHEICQCFTKNKMSSRCEYDIEINT